MSGPKMFALRPSLLLLLLSGAGVATTTRTQFFAVGGTIKLELDPRPAEGISRLVWKRQRNMVAEWTGGDFQSYGPFKERTEVDNRTGRLEVREATAEDSGPYGVEVNDRLQDLDYQVWVIQPVPKPKVWVQPLVCGPSSAECRLSCDGPTEGAKPVTYSWIRGGEDGAVPGKELVITNLTASVRTFSCRMENGLGHRDSDPKENPFFRHKASILVPVLVPLLVVVVLLLPLGLLVYCFRTKIKAFLRRDGHVPVNQTPSPGEDIALNQSGN